MNFWFHYTCSKILDRVVSVEYALRDDGERGDKWDEIEAGLPQ